MLEFNPKLEININRQPKPNDSGKTVDAKNDQPAEMKREVTPTALPTQIIVQVDGFQLLLLCLVIAVLILSAATLIHGMRA